MPMVVNFEKMLVQKKMSFPEFMEKAGVTRSGLSVLKSNKAKLLRITSLDTIYKTLDCQPGDILEYISAREDATIQTNSSNEVQYHD